MSSYTSGDSSCVYQITDVAQAMVNPLNPLRRPEGSALVLADQALAVPLAQPLLSRTLLPLIPGRLKCPDRPLLRISTAP
jgi:hypothetical protein